jgi:hypothetical protein
MIMTAPLMSSLCGPRVFGEATCGQGSNTSDSVHPRTYARGRESSTLPRRALRLSAAETHRPSGVRPGETMLALDVSRLAQKGLDIDRYETERSK